MKIKKRKCVEIEKVPGGYILTCKDRKRAEPKEKYYLRTPEQLTEMVEEWIE